MTSHANDIIVHKANGGCIAVEFNGELSRYIEGLRWYVARADGVTRAEVIDENKLSAEFEFVDDLDTVEQVRIRIRNKCRDYLHGATGFLTNLEPEGSFADLIEHTALARH